MQINSSPQSAVKKQELKERRALRRKLPGKSVRL